MKILLTGATGYVGGEVGKRLVELGHEVISLTRDKNKKAKFETKMIELSDLSSEEGVQAVIHLAGASVVEQKWTADYKRVLTSSRVAFTHKILRELNYADLEVFVQASATSFYQSSGDDILTEHSDVGESFLSKLYEDWENTSRSLNCRRVCFRMGTVVGPNSPAMLKAEKRRGSVLGGGEQHLSWIHIDDLVEMFVGSIEDYEYSGVYNAVSPSSLTNKAFKKTLAQTAGKPSPFLGAPKFMLKMVYGEMSQTFLDSHRVEPKNLKQKGFEFKYSKMEEALNASI